MKEKLKNVFFRVWYWCVSTIDKNAKVIFMNYGYSKDNHKIKFDENDEKNRYFTQLYNLVATGANIKGKDVLEIACGRGGGLSYINRYLSPNYATDGNSTYNKFLTQEFEYLFCVLMKHPCTN